MKTKHKKGYHVWLYGDCYWHRTLEGAIRRSEEARNWCNLEHNQIIECATGDQFVETRREVFEERA